VLKGRDSDSHWRVQFPCPPPPSPNHTPTLCLSVSLSPSLPRSPCISLSFASWLSQSVSRLSRSVVGSLCPHLSLALLPKAAKREILRSRHLIFQRWDLRISESFVFYVYSMLAATQFRASNDLAQAKAQGQSESQRNGNGASHGSRSHRSTRQWTEPCYA
jgi:hypothetical protein